MKLTRIIQIHGKVEWRYSRTKQGNYVAVCDALAQTVQAPRFGELVEMVSEAFQSTFK
ncbi:MAG: hypothetical protein HY300_08330 [Verrucomicrobia bacterium]|nr:hypothetical protein [Verrucomicrobiota bacterium]